MVSLLTPFWLMMALCVGLGDLGRGYWGEKKKTSRLEAP